MPLPLFSPVSYPHVSGSSTAVGIRGRTIRFGDGYQQRSEDGLNSRPRSGTWSWSMIDEADALSIVDFLSANAITGFRFSLPGDQERKYEVPDGDRSISIGYPGGPYRDLSVKVEEKFDP